MVCRKPLGTLQSRISARPENATVVHLGRRPSRGGIHILNQSNLYPTHVFQGNSITLAHSDHHHIVATVAATASRLDGGATASRLGGRGGFTHYRVGVWGGGGCIVADCRRRKLQFYAPRFAPNYPHRTGGERRGGVQDEAKKMASVTNGIE